MDFDFPAKKKTLKKELSRKSSRNKEPKLDYILLSTLPEIQEKLTVELDKQLLIYISENDDLDTMNTKIVSKTVKNAVEAVCPINAESKKKKEPWEDAKIKEMMFELHKRNLLWPKSLLYPKSFSAYITKILDQKTSGNLISALLIDLFKKSLGKIRTKIRT